MENFIFSAVKRKKSKTTAKFFALDANVESVNSDF